MKTKFVIFYYDVKNQEADKIHPEGWVLATSLVQALKFWHVNLRGAFFQNSTYETRELLIK